jgi:DeoR family transcriptional regulator of aga operon
MRMDSRLFQHERRGLIATLVNQEGRVSVADLCARFGLSAATIRTDLDDLVHQGLVIRTHGGAIPTDHRNTEMSFEVRRRLCMAQKARIGAAAAAMIVDGEAIVLDASTTALAVANAIRGRHELTVLTNGLYIALALLLIPGVTVLMAGGFLRPDSVSVVGTDGHDLVQKYNFQKGFFGGKGLDLKEGLTDVNRDEVAIKGDLVKRAKRVIAVIDSSKWGRVGFARFAAIDELHCVVTDDGAPPDMVAALRDAGVEVVIA